MSAMSSMNGIAASRQVAPLSHGSVRRHMRGGGGGRHATHTCRRSSGGVRCVVYAHGGAGTASGAKTKGFVGEMRKVAMKLHTKEQSPEGEAKKKEEHEGQVRKWQPTLCGYYKFLTQSKHVYDFIESKMAEQASLNGAQANNKQYSLFVNTGLERSEGLAQDVEYMKTKIREEIGEEALLAAEGSTDEADEVGQVYVKYLKELEETSFPKVMQTLGNNRSQCLGINVSILSVQYNTILLWS